jgi:phage terminase small subunit
MRGKNVGKKPKREPKPRVLSERERRFAQELVKSNNQTEAAIFAGFSPRSAGTIASRLLTYPHVSAYVAELRAEITRRNALDADKIVQRLMAIAQTDFRDVAVFDGRKVSYKPMEEWPENAHQALWMSEDVKGIGKGEDFQVVTVTKIDKPDKIGALAQLATIAGLNRDLNTSLACLRSYGIDIKKDNNGKWVLTEVQPIA